MANVFTGIIVACAIIVTAIYVNEHVTCISVFGSKPQACIIH